METGAAALALARRQSFDLMIADVFLPDGSGIEFFRQVRALSPDIAGVVITGHSTWELAVEALNAGFVGFLVKPMVTEQLVAAVVNALEQEKLRRENARLRAIVPLFELSHTFMGDFSLDELLHRIVMAAQRETRAQIVSLMLLDPTEQELGIAAAVGLPDQIIETERVPVGRGIAGRVAQSGEPLMLTESVPLDPEIRRLMKKPEVLSSLSLPLRVRNRVIGVLNLSRMHGDEAFNTGDLEIATVFAGQAAMAIAQTRLFDQLKALNEITQVLAGAIDLDEAITAIVRAPQRLVDATETILWLIEGALQPVLLESLSAKDQVQTLAREKILAQFTASKDATNVTLPLQHGDKLLGALQVRLPSLAAASEERLGALRTLAHTASAVIESLSLRARQVGAFREVDHALRADLNLQQLLNRLLAEMVSACEADGGAIFLRAADGARLEVWSALRFSGGDALAQTIWRAPRAQIIADASDPTQAYIGAPLLIGGRADGAIVLARAAQFGGFTPRHVEWLATLASTAALLVRNAQLYARSEEAAIIEERTRIAREIHDGLAQDLTYLVLKISAAQKLASQGKVRELHKELDEISNQLRRDMRDVRHTIFALRPLDIETEGFLPALQKFAKEFGMTTEVEVPLAVQGDASRLAPKMETALFRLTQEALNNIRKHARAKHVWIALNLDDPRAAVLDVRDDGAGFDLEKASQAARARGSVGLVQMRERAERAGGTFSITTAPGKGTQIHVELPTREQ
ncbi:MAG: GAF domain-containing protein [Chloroflexi bacterium]|nr:GAF domain-containing protein [Chloroflexota bacterium]